VDNWKPCGRRGHRIASHTGGGGILAQGPGVPS
jgi:hypothetical protein